MKQSDIDIQITRAKDYLKSENEKIEKVKEILESYPPTGKDERRYYTIEEELETLERENKKRNALISYIEANKNHFQKTYQITEYTSFIIDTRFYDGFLHPYATVLVTFPPQTKVGNSDIISSMERCFLSYLNMIIKIPDFYRKLEDFNRADANYETKDVAFLHEIDSFFSYKESKQYKKLEKWVQKIEKAVMDLSSFVLDD